MPPAAGGAAAGWWRPAYAVAVLALVAPRLHSGSALWLDEALSVDIARLSLPELFSALRRDGSPPLYYLVLHAWMGVFGTGDDAVRALSTVCSLAALPVAYAVGRRLGGRSAASAALLVVAASPFAIRYATETRMYALVMLLALLLLWAVVAALERPAASRLAAVAMLSGLLLLTHYWALFLVGALVAGLLVASRREGTAAVKVAGAVSAGGVLFLPWLPTFLFQAAHTGTPWRPAPTWVDFPHTLLRWGGPGPAGTVLGVGIVLLAMWGVRDRAGRWLLTLGLAGLALGLVAGMVQGAAFALRYSAPLLVPVLLAAALGLANVPAAARQVVSVMVVALSLAVVTTSSLLGVRTQAAPTAAVLRAGLGPGDLVVYCPDQLGPAVARLLPAATRQVVYPTMASPDLIDWVDYAARNAAASPTTFADRVDQTTSGRVWLIRADGFLTYGDQCAELDDSLTTLRGGRTVRQTPGSERDGTYVVEFAAKAAATSHGSAPMR